MTYLVQTGPRTIPNSKSVQRISYSTRDLISLPHSQVSEFFLRGFEVLLVYVEKLIRNLNVDIQRNSLFEIVKLRLSIIHTDNAYVYCVCVWNIRFKHELLKQHMLLLGLSLTFQLQRSVSLIRKVRLRFQVQIYCCT